jgi:hypothetical protein
LRCHFLAELTRVRRNPLEPTIAGRTKHD